MRITAVFLLVAIAYAQDAKDERKPPTPQQKALALVDKGRALILEDAPQAAIDHLQKAIGQLQQLLVKGLAAWLPKKFDDWTVGKIETDTGSWGTGDHAVQWHQARRVYTSPDGRLKLDATISNSPQHIQGQRQVAKMYMNKQMVEMMNKNNPDTTIETVEVDGWVGWSVRQKNRDATFVAMAKKVMLSLRINSDDVSVLKKFWEMFDRKGCAAAHK